MGEPPPGLARAQSTGHLCIESSPLDLTPVSRSLALSATGHACRWPVVLLTSLSGAGPVLPGA